LKTQEKKPNTRQKDMKTGEKQKAETVGVKTNNTNEMVVYFLLEMPWNNRSIPSKSPSALVATQG